MIPITPLLLPRWIGSVVTPQETNIESATDERQNDVLARLKKVAISELVTTSDDVYFDALQDFETEIVEEEEFFDCEEELPVTLFTQDEYNEMYGVEPEEERSDGWLAWAIKKGSDVVKSVSESQTVQNGKAFSKGLIGRTLISKGASMVVKQVGMVVGAAFPEATMTYTVARYVAASYLKDSENKSYLSTGIGVSAAVTVTYLSTSLSYFTGTPDEYNRALGYVVITAGTVAGGMGALQTMGYEVSVDHAPRSVASIVTRDIVGTVAHGVTAAAEYIPLPLVPTVIHVGGEVVTSLSGVVAYYGDKAVIVTEQMTKPQLQSKNLYDPGEFTQNVVIHSNGDSKMFSEAMAKKFVESPLLASIARLLIQQTVDRKVATNALARAVNRFAEFMQNATVQEKIRELRATPGQLGKDALQKEIAALAARDYGILEKPIAIEVKIVAGRIIPSLIHQVTDLMGKKEVEFFGMTLSDDKQTRDLLEALLPVLIPMVGVYTKRELISTKDLSKEEVEAFYGNLSAALLTPYQAYRLGRGLDMLVATAIPFMQQYAQFLPSLLSESIGQSLAEPVINLDEKAIQKKEPTRKLGILEWVWKKIQPFRQLSQFIQKSFKYIIEKLKSLY